MKMAVAGQLPLAYPGTKSEVYLINLADFLHLSKCLGASS